jgi:hypothetical protein
MMTILVATLMASAKHLARRMIGMSRCWRCSHVGQETTNDVTCCNLCEEGDECWDFFDPVEDPYNEDDPYVVTNPMAYY